MSLAYDIIKKNIDITNIFNKLTQRYHLIKYIKICNTKI